MRPITNACGHEYHDRPDVHGCVFLNRQRVHDRESEHGGVHGYEHPQNRGYVGEYVDVDVRANLSCCLRYFMVKAEYPINSAKAYHPVGHFQTDPYPELRWSRSKTERDNRAEKLANSPTGA